MDQVRIGRFIAALRRREGLTQRALGNKIGVTNKTVSRWENGNYMPDIEMLQLLAQVFHVSINELLAGEMLPDKEFGEKEEENVTFVPEESAFSFDEKKAYWIRKWRREHISLFVLLSAIVLVFVVVPFIINEPWLTGLVPLVAFLAYGYQNNQMMIYVEDHLYGLVK